jgi:hypothetical protein
MEFLSKENNRKILLLIPVCKQSSPIFFEDKDGALFDPVDVEDLSGGRSIGIEINAALFVELDLGGVMDAAFAFIFGVQVHFEDEKVVGASEGRTLLHDFAFRDKKNPNPLFRLLFQGDIEHPVCPSLGIFHPAFVGRPQRLIKTVEIPGHQVLLQPENLIRRGIAIDEKSDILGAPFNVRSEYPAFEIHLGQEDWRRNEDSGRKDRRLTDSRNKAVHMSPPFIYLIFKNQPVSCQ